MGSAAGVTCEAEETTVPVEEHTFTHAEFPGYTDPDKSVLRMVDDKRTLVQRRQPSGLCHMHAPAVVQYYSIWNTALKAGQAAPGHGMLDLTVHIAKNFSPLELSSYVFDEEGVPSTQFLRGILQPHSKIKPLWIKDDPLSHLREYGPALVSQFHVYSDFLDKSVHKHYTPPPGPQHNMYGPSNSQYKGLHAMVLVGARVDSSGNRFYLLQNWWAGKQFVEVSHEYLDFCDPSIYYVVTPQTGVPKGIPTHAVGIHFVETAANTEKAEGLPRERGGPDQLL